MIRPNILKRFFKLFIKQGRVKGCIVKEVKQDNSIQTPSEVVVHKDYEDLTVVQAENDVHSESHNLDFVRVKTDISIKNTLVLGLSLLGESHKRHMKGCQDFHIFRDLGEDWHLFIVSDGAGSAKHAEVGSKCNCELTAELVATLVSQRDWKNRNDLPTELEWYIEIRSIFEKIKLHFRNEMNDFPDTTEKDFNATILVCIKTPFGILSSHIGDGRMGYRNGDGVWKSLMKPHKGEEANQTVFLQNSWTTPNVPSLRINDNYVPEVRVVKDSVSSIVLMSDGCERAAWECVIWNEEIEKYEDRNNPYPKFLDPLIDALDETPREEKILCFQEILECGTEACRKETDDKTMLIGVY